MRTLVISDIHGNVPALEAVLAQPHDLVLCLGDVVGFGPDPAECVRRLRRAGAVACVQGNHDLSWARAVPCGAPPALAAMADAVRAALAPELDIADRVYLDQLPAQVQLPLAGTQTSLVHAAPSHPQRANVPPTPEAWSRELALLPALDLLLVGHTHVQFELVLQGGRVVNPGSVGLPSDGDATAAYALVDNGAVALKRARYDVDATVRRLRERRLPDAAVGAITAWLRDGRMPPGLLGPAPARHPLQPT